MNMAKHKELLVKFHNLQGTDNSYTFYYDETNNIRRLYFTDNGLNTSNTDNFVLAGVLHKGNFEEIDYNEIFENLNLQKSVKELKLKHIAKGNFLAVLSSKKVNILLDWLIKKNFFIHYFNLNLIYWCITDIIDSIVGELRHPYYVMAHMHLKSDLYEVASVDQKSFLAGLQKFNYPDIPKVKVQFFCEWLHDYICMNSSNLPGFRGAILKSLVNQALDLENLPLITGDHRNDLISDFMAFYFRNLILFDKSKHFFDEELQVQPLLDEFITQEGGCGDCSYQFLRSDLSKGIQISDVISGFLGKYFTYLKDVSDDQIKIDRVSLTDSQLGTLDALVQLINTSDTESRGFFNSVFSEGEQRRNNFFLHGSELDTD